MIGYQVMLMGIYTHNIYCGYIYTQICIFVCIYTNNSKLLFAKNSYFDNALIGFLGKLN